MPDDEPLFDPGVIEAASKNQSWDSAGDEISPSIPQEKTNPFDAEKAIRWKCSEDPEVQHQVDRIRQRNPEDLKANFDRAIAALEATYVADQQAHKRPLMRFVQPDVLTKRKYKNELHTKADRFAGAFAEPVFGNIMHAVKGELPDEVMLKSPSMLALEGRKGLEDTVTSSGPLDREIGNTDYVFAATTELPSRSFAFSNAYKIDSQEGYAVPVDIVDLKLTDEQWRPGEGKSYDDIQLGLYADNMYTLQEFKQFFATYSATFFDSPDQALRFYQAHGRNVVTSAFWEFPTSTTSRGELDTQDRALFKRMEKLSNDHRVFPPLVPEFQFKHSVPARRVPDEVLLEKIPGYR